MQLIYRQQLGVTTVVIIMLGITTLSVTGEGVENMPNGSLIT